MLVALDPVISLGGLRLVAIVAGTLAVLLIGIVFAGSRAVARDMRGRLGSRAPVVVHRSWVQRIPVLGRFAQGAEDAARRRGLLTALSGLLERANLPVRPGEALVGALLLAGIAGILVAALTTSLLYGAMATVAVILGVLAAIQRLATRERRRFDEQLPDTLNLLSTSLKAGYSLLQAVEAVAREASEPTAREFGRAISEIRLGAGIADAIGGVADRMGSIDFAWVVMAIEIQREVGGNLAEVLTTAGDTIIARNRLRGDTRALTAEGRISAVVLTIVPIVIGLFLFTTNRDYLDPLFDTTAGRIGLVGSLIAFAVGVFWIRRIVEIDL